MAMLTDAILTYLIVAAAAGFVVWRIFLPLRVRIWLRYALRGRKAPCATEPETGGCAVGCSGCSLAKVKKT